jgi:hypothetical protein
VPRGNGDTVSVLPHSALVSQALVAFAMNYEEKSPVALSLSGTVIRLIPPEGCPLQGLGDSAGVSALVRHGFLCVSGNPGREIVHLTPKGFAVSCAYDGRIQAVEKEWRNALGEASIALLRRALEEVAEAASHTTRIVRDRLVRPAVHHLRIARDTGAIDKRGPTSTRNLLRLVSSDPVPRALETHDLCF